MTKIEIHAILACMNIKELKLVGAALYACEGTKARRDYRSQNRMTYSIELTNSDVKIIAFFSLFLKKILKIDWDRLRGQLFIYPDLNEDDIKLIWSKASGIPLGQFQKTIVLKQKIGKFKSNPLGTFKVRYSSKKDFLKLQEIIGELWIYANISKR